MARSDTPEQVADARLVFTRPCIRPLTRRGPRAGREPSRIRTARRSPRGCRQSTGSTPGRGDAVWCTAARARRTRSGRASRALVARSRDSSSTRRVRPARAARPDPPPRRDDPLPVPRRVRGARGSPRKARALPVAAPPPARLDGRLPRARRRRSLRGGVGPDDPRRLRAGGDERRRRQRCRRRIQARVARACRFRAIRSRSSTTSGNELPPGVEGELAVRGRPPTLFAGYWESPDETKRRSAETGTSTGDIATVDADGFLWFVGRAADMITSRGERSARTRSSVRFARHDSVAQAPSSESGTSSEAGSS